MDVEEYNRMKGQGQKPAPKYNREQRLAIIKASNEMLSDAVENLIERGASEDVIDSVKQSIGENYTYAKNNLGASADDVKNAMYHGASISEIRAYEDRLKRKGLTDESVHQKAIATVTTGDERSKKTKSERNVKGIGYNGDEGDVVSEDEYNEKEGTAKQKRRARRKKETGRDEPVHTKEYIEEAVQEPVVIEAKKEPEIVEIKPKSEKKDKKEKKIKESEKKNYGIEQFNLADIPDYVQYDMIPLPSNGECYPHKKGRLPVAYLTASDENLIASPNMYRDGKLLDIILRRKILDKSINVDELCSGDRDAIIIWLRATAYGDEFPISATDRDTGKRYDTVVKLSSLKYKELKLKGDENGHFTFNAPNGDVIKFRYFSKAVETDLRDRLASEAVNFSKFNALKAIDEIRWHTERIGLDEEDYNMVVEDLDEMDEIISNNGEGVDEIEYPSIITEQMIEHTVSVNGKTDRDYIKGYIENMRSKVAYDYRNYISDNRPGIDFNITINKPESDGGGSFDTFLRIDDFVFVNF